MRDFHGYINKMRWIYFKNVFTGQANATTAETYK